jgi:hypothetical protein
MLNRNMMFLKELINISPINEHGQSSCAQMRCEFRVEQANLEISRLLAGKICSPFLFQPGGLKLTSRKRQFEPEFVDAQSGQEAAPRPPGE